MGRLSSFSLKSTGTEKTLLRRCCSYFLDLFSLNGHLSYAFIYGSWEIIRARKVGTTHTKIDYVVYRLFYPMILIAAGLFAVLVEEDLGKFFCLFEVWCMILHIMYAFVFLQNVLANNLHRDNVKHRQKIPERLVVTDEIERGGHKFYICKRYSILPTEKLYYTESLIWFLFNCLASLNVVLMLGHMTNQIDVAYKLKDDIGHLRAYAMGLLMLSDAILTPIPVHLAHIIFPTTFYAMYLAFLVIIYKTKGIILYTTFDLRSTTQSALVEVSIARLLFIMLIHVLLTGLVALRDYIISLLDDSRTPKQLQNLRSQKRLARRKLMNYTMGPDGRITGIFLERHDYDPGLDEFIKTTSQQKRALRQRELYDDEDTDFDDESEEAKSFRSDDGDGDTGNKEAAVSALNAIPLSTKIKPPPQLRYTTPEKDEQQFSSSSSSTEGDTIEAIRKSINKLPSPPKEPAVDLIKRGSLKQQKIWKRDNAPTHKFGVVVKPRDSKENIQHKMESVGDGQGIPPFIRLVQALIKVNKQVKGEVEQERKLKTALETEGHNVQSAAGTALVQVKRAENTRGTPDVVETTSQPKDKNMYTQTGKQGNKKPVISTQAGRGRVAPVRGGKKMDTSYIDKLIEDATTRSTYAKERKREELERANKKSSDDDAVRSKRARFDSPGAKEKPTGSRVIHLRSLNESGEQIKQVDTMSGFNQELSNKLQRVQNKKFNLTESGKFQNKQQDGQGAKKKRRKGPKSILKRTEFGGGGGEMLPSEKIKRREKRLMKRRDERAMQGKHGLPVYDPLSAPQNVGGIATTYHYLGTKLKGEKADTLRVSVKDLPLYRSHLGIGTKDDEADQGPRGKAIGETEKSLVAFHPIVKYFEVNEINEPRTKGLGAGGAQLRLARQ